MSYMQVGAALGFGPAGRPEDRSSKTRTNACANWSSRDLCRAAPLLACGMLRNECPIC